MNATKLLTDIACSLVDNPDQVRVTEDTSEQGVVTLTLTVADGDMGKVIGKGGRIARAIRMIMKSASSVAGQKIFVEIKD